MIQLDVQRVFHIAGPVGGVSFVPHARTVELDPVDGHIGQYPFITVNSHITIQDCIPAGIIEIDFNIRNSGWVIQIL